MDNRGWIIGYVGNDRVAFVDNPDDYDFISPETKQILYHMQPGEFYPLDDIYVRCVTHETMEEMKNQLTGGKEDEK